MNSKQREAFWAKQNKRIIAKLSARGLTCVNCGKSALTSYNGLGYCKGCARQGKFRTDIQ